MSMDQTAAWVLGGECIRLFPLLNKQVSFYLTPGIWYLVDATASHHLPRGSQQHLPSLRGPLGIT